MVTRELLGLVLGYQGVTRELPESYQGVTRELPGVCYQAVTRELPWLVLGYQGVIRELPQGLVTRELPGVGYQRVTRELLGVTRELPESYKGVTRVGY